MHNDLSTHLSSAARAITSSQCTDRGWAGISHAGAAQASLSLSLTCTMCARFLIVRLCIKIRRRQKEKVTGNRLWRFARKKRLDWISMNDQIATQRLWSRISDTFFYSIIPFVKWAVHASCPALFWNVIILRSNSRSSVQAPRPAVIWPRVCACVHKAPPPLVPWLDLISRE